MEEISHDELPFSPDFAVRVLEEADHVMAKRERLAHMGVLAALVAVTGAFGVWSMVEPQAPKAVAPATFAANTQTMSSAVAESAQTEPLDYMFPEAAPLAQFADSYSGSVTSATTTRQNILFSGETGQGAE